MTAGRHVFSCIALFAAVMLASCADDVRDQDSVLVAAASDLRPAFDELGAMFEEDTGTAVTFTYGSSGVLREQILDGAPFQIFASANTSFVDEVIAAGRADSATRATYAFGRLVVIAAPGVEPPGTLEELSDIVTVNGTDRRIAIANPEHAPYGIAAQQALATVGVLDVVRSRLVLGESVADAVRIVESGNAEFGIVARSLAIAADLPHVDIPPDLHAPIEQTLVVTREGDANARTFAEFLRSDRAREVLAKYGFAEPGQA